MGGRPRVCHLECGEHQTTIVNGEEIAGHVTGDCVDVAGPLRSAASSLCAQRKTPALSPGPGASLCATKLLPLEDVEGVGAEAEGLDQPPGHLGQEGQL